MATIFENTPLKGCLQLLDWLEWWTGLEKVDKNNIEVIGYRVCSVECICTSLDSIAIAMEGRQKVQILL